MMQDINTARANLAFDGYHVDQLKIRFVSGNASNPLENVYYYTKNNDKTSFPVSVKLNPYTSFMIPVTLEEMNNIDHKERKFGVDHVVDLLEQVDGVFDADFDGHFGLYVYLSIQKEFHNDKTLQLISEIINREGKQNPDMDGYR